MRRVFLILISLLSAIILWVNVQLYTENHSVKEKQKDIIEQLNFLESELKTNDLGNRMQAMFPEGYVFVNALYGLSWCELALAYGVKDEIKTRATMEALYAYDQIDSDRGREVFNETMVPAYGIFYQGWRNYLLSKIVSIDVEFENKEYYVNQFNENCELIFKAVQSSETPYLSSYPNQCWPADMFVAMASLSNYNILNSNTYQFVVDSWLEKVKGHLDMNTGLVPHRVEATSGRSLGGARGSSSSLILRMLSEIGGPFARNQYDRFESHFMTTTFGLPSVREYPKGTFGLGDVDSGPVIFGVGFSATIVNIGLQSRFGEFATSERQYKTINAFGFKRRMNEKKSYLFGALPMADAFIAWGRASDLSSMRPLKYVNHNNLFWKQKFNMIALLFISLLWTVYFGRRIIKKIIEIRVAKLSKAIQPPSAD